MFKKIIVPVDLSDHHGRTLTVACHLARQNAGTVTLVHAIELIPGLQPSDDQEFYAKLEKNARKHLSRLEHECGGHEFKVNSAVVFGTRAGAVMAFASQMQADLIVLTSHRVTSEMGDSGWGTLSH